MIVYGSGGFPLRLGPAILFLLSFFAHIYALARARANTYGTLIKNEPLFIEFTIFHVSSRLSSPAGASSFFEVTTHPVYVEPFRANILWGALKGEREKTLHYNYQRKKV